MLAATVDCEGSVKQKGCGVISRIYGAEGLGERKKIKKKRLFAARTGLEPTHLTERNVEAVHTNSNTFTTAPSLRPASMLKQHSITLDLTSLNLFIILTHANPFIHANSSVANNQCMTIGSKPERVFLNKLLLCQQITLKSTLKFGEI